MTTAFPGAKDTFINPDNTKNMNDVGVQHDVQHANINDAMAAVQTSIGVTGSTDTNSIIYKLTQRQNSIGFTNPPALASSTGTQGTVIVSGGYIYICIATNTWVRNTVASW